jgi:hypothetical protein
VCCLEVVVIDHRPTAASLGHEARRTIARLGHAVTALHATHSDSQVVIIPEVTKPGAEIAPGLRPDQNFTVVPFRFLTCPNVTQTFILTVWPTGVLGFVLEFTAP